MLYNFFPQLSQSPEDIMVVSHILILLFLFQKVFTPLIYIFIYLFIYFGLCWVFVAAHGFFSSCGEWGLLFVAVRRLLIAVASLVGDHGL